MISDIEFPAPPRFSSASTVRTPPLEAAQRADAKLEKGDIPMSAMGHKRTFSDTLSNVRYWGQSGHPEVPFEISPFECPLSGVKRTFASYPLDVCL